jgi:hypothetical protein
MGKSSAETVREIEETRVRLDAEIRELEDRLPAPAVWAKRLVGVAVGGGVAGSALLFGMRTLRKRRKQKAERVQAVVQVLPERWAERVSEAMEDGRWRQWIAVGGAVWLVLRLAELRQLRRTNKLLVTAPVRPY